MISLTVDMENKKMKKPTLMPALWLTVIWLIACLGIWFARSDTMTIYVHNYGRYSNPLANTGEDPAVEVLDIEEHEEYFAVKLRALKTNGTYDFRIQSADDPELSSYIVVDIDSKGRITENATGNFSGWKTLYPLTLIWIAGCTLIFYMTFFRQKKYSVFSYNTIIYLGFGFMGTLMTVVFLLNMLSAFESPEYSSMMVFLDTIYSSVGTYAFLSFPVLLILTIGLIISNLFLWKREGRGFTNTVAMIFGIILTAGNLLVIIAPGFTGGYVPTARIQMSMINALSALFLYLESMWLGAVGAGIITARMKADCDRDYLIILGCGMREDGTPTPLLRGRCDAALRFNQRQLETSGKQAKFIPSGGQGDDEIISESECMKNYLVSQGISENDILMENRSTTTMENFRFSKQLIPEENAKCAFFTTKYHVFRSGIWARRAGFARDAIQSEGASTKWYFWPNAFVREFIGLLTQHRLKQAIIIGSLFLFYGGATYLLFFR